MLSYDAMLTLTVINTVCTITIVLGKDTWLLCKFVWVLMTMLMWLTVLFGNLPN